MRLLLSLLLLAAAPVWAQNDRQLLPAVPPPPPEMAVFNAVIEPQVTIVRNDKETREEYRVKGKLYMVKVTPKVGPVFYLIDQQGDGNFIESDTIGPMTKPPMWTVHSW